MDSFVSALTDAAGYGTKFPACDRILADIDDGDLVNVFDIDPLWHC